MKEQSISRQSARDSGGSARPRAGSVVVHKQNCKSCGLCVEFCPRKVLQRGKEVNAMGYRAVEYRGDGCIACRVCQLVCPEPGAIDVNEE